MRRRTVLGFLTTAALVLSIFALLPLTLQPVKASPPLAETEYIIFTVMPDGSVQITSSFHKPADIHYNKTFAISIKNDMIISNYSHYWASSSDSPFMYLESYVLNDKMNVSFDYDFCFNTTGSPFKGDLSFNIDYNGNQGSLTLNADFTDMNMTKLIEDLLSTSLMFEIPSFTGSLNINNGVLTGLITFSTSDLIALPIKMNIWMNDTNIRLYGDGGLIYQGELLNSSHLDFFSSFMSNLTGTSENSLYNITDGTVLCTHSVFNYTNTTIGGKPGATINFDFKAENSTWGLRKVFMAPLIYNTIGGRDWNKTAAVMYEYEQMTANSVGGSTLSYNAATQKLTWSGSQTINLKNVINSLEPPIEVGWWPPSYGVPEKLYVNNSDLQMFFMEVFMTSKVLQGSFNVKLHAGATVGTQNYTGRAEIDFKDIVKDYEDFMNQTMPFFGEWWWNENVTFTEAGHVIKLGPGYSIENGWQKYTGGYAAIEYYINNIDGSLFPYIDNLFGQINKPGYLWDVLAPISFNNTIRSLNLKLDNFYIEVRADEGYGFTELVTGVFITPPKTSVNASWYNLNSLFEAEAGLYPTTNKSLGILVSGGSNGTHHTILSYQGLKPPHSIVKDSSGNAVAMFWDNESIPNLKDLLFSVYTGDVTGGYADPNYLPAIFNAPALGVTLKIVNISNPTGLLISEALNPPAPGEGLTPISYYVNITATDTFTGLDAWLTFHYTDEQIAGVDENSLNIYWFNPATNMYEPLSDVVHNTVENWISGHLTHFSVFVLFSFTPSGLPLWIIIPIVVGVIAVGVGVYLAMRRRGIKGRVEK